jgi:hypothetical protein
MVITFFAGNSALIGSANLGGSVLFALYVIMLTGGVHETENEF